MYYRVEVNPNNIGAVVETPFSLNPTRVNVAQNLERYDDIQSNC